MKRVAHYNITELNDKEIFVFGSNEAGRHGKGAARKAMRWGAKRGQAAGLMGQTYGIPTKDKKVKTPLSISKIEKYVNEFIECAKQNPDLTFLVTAIGTGLSHYKYADIAPLFTEAMCIENVHLPMVFWKVLDADGVHWDDTKKPLF